MCLYHSLGCLTQLVWYRQQWLLCGFLQWHLSHSSSSLIHSLTLFHHASPSISKYFIIFFTCAQLLKVFSDSTHICSLHMQYISKVHLIYSIITSFYLFENISVSLKPNYCIFSFFFLHHSIASTECSLRLYRSTTSENIGK